MKAQPGIRRPGSRRGELGGRSWGFGSGIWDLFRISRFGFRICSGFRIWDLGFVSGFEIRISDLFRVWDLGFVPDFGFGIWDLFRVSRFGFRICSGFGISDLLRISGLPPAGESRRGGATPRRPSWPARAASAPVARGPLELPHPPSCSSHPRSPPQRPMLPQLFVPFVGS